MPPFTKEKEMFKMLGALTSGVTILGLTLGGAFWLDDRHASQDDFLKLDKVGGLLEKRIDKKIEQDKIDVIRRKYEFLLLLKRCRQPEFQGVCAVWKRQSEQMQKALDRKK